ncbi:MAG TPA: hypothetical protein VGH80_02835 [Xanthomonadaceae bacterium]|jgi:uncharacterized protein (DUF58 family)
MAWILLLLAVGCFVFTFFTTSIGLGVTCVLLSLLLVVVSILMLLSSRVGSASRDAIPMSPEEWRSMRDQAEARRAAKATSGSPDAASPAQGDTPPPPASPTV